MKPNTLFVGLSVLALNVATVTRASDAAPQSVSPPAITPPAETSTTSSPAQQPNPFKVPVSGVLADGTIFNGVMEVTKLTTDDNGKLVADGVLTGTAQGVGGGAATTISQTIQQIAIAVSAPTGQCDVVKLNLDALNLDALGAVVDLAPVDLNVIADSAGGKLLGNLLCSVAHLLDNPLSGLLGLGDLLGKVNDLIGGNGSLLGGLLGGALGGGDQGGGLLGGLLGGGDQGGGLLGGLLGGGDQGGGLLGGLLGGSSVPSAPAGTGISAASTGPTTD